MAFTPGSCGLFRGEPLSSYVRRALVDRLRADGFASAEYGFAA
jgi:hypothetical protein